MSDDEWYHLEQNPFHFYRVKWSVDILLFCHFTNAVQNNRLTEQVFDLDIFIHWKLEWTCNFSFIFSDLNQ